MRLAPTLLVEKWWNQNKSVPKNAVKFNYNSYVTIQIRQEQNIKIPIIYSAENNKDSLATSQQKSAPKTTSKDQLRMKSKKDTRKLRKKKRKKKKSLSNHSETWTVLWQRVNVIGKGIQLLEYEAECVSSKNQAKGEIVRLVFLFSFKFS